MKVTGTVTQDIEISEFDLNGISIRQLINLLGDGFYPQYVHDVNAFVSDTGKLVRTERQRGDIEHTEIRVATELDRAIMVVIKELRFRK